MINGRTVFAGYGWDIALKRCEPECEANLGQRFMPVMLALCRLMFQYFKNEHVQTEVSHQMVLSAHGGIAIFTSPTFK